MWQRHAKLASTQTDALNVLHAACGHLPAACEQLAAWHTERGHALAASVYQKRVDAARRGATVQPAGANAIALAADLATVMHVSDVSPRSDAIAQMVGHELRAPVAHEPSAAPKAQHKPLPMHAAAQGMGTDVCASTATLNRHSAPLRECVTEVRPLDDDQIALRNRCSQAVTVAYAGARADRSTFTNQLRLEPYEARSAGISHRELGPLTYAVCSGECRVTSAPDDATAAWTGQSAQYYCAAGGRP
jgi:hypothetical protein